ncbi:putative sensor domain DACNV-containing protein [Pontibacter pamirensis]|uniref:putative sensor domain DACNV-containing protein n=1 Tax=Pontibacter pamirensis TaxID=2562824 RepID=UPI00138A02E9|nr:hypothetical protein [Pontibacter pamirensis]
MPLKHHTTYRAAKAVAKTVEGHFVRHLAASRQGNEEKMAPEPDAKVIEILIDTAFWASLRREEGHSPKISLAFLPPELAGQPLLLEHRLPLNPSVLVKLAPAVERPGIHLGVWQYEDELYVWGATREIPSLCLVLDVSEPGLLVVKYRRTGGMGKFANIAVLKGDQVKVLEEQTIFLQHSPPLLSTLLGFSSPSPWGDSVNVLVQLAVSMRAHKRGGTLLIVPAGTQAWRKSIIHPILYSVAPAFDKISELMRENEEEQRGSEWQSALNKAVEGIAGVTAVDGATVISDQYELLAFGSKIGRPQGSSPVEKVVVTEPVVGSSPTVIAPSQNGGTRHLSAAQFVHDQRDAFALVASQDGGFTIFAWSPHDQLVHAHRIDILLL